MRSFVIKNIKYIFQKILLLEDATPLFKKKNSISKLFVNLRLYNFGSKNKNKVFYDWRYSIMKLTPAALLFDMDGTLTEPRQLISHEMLDTLYSISPTIRKYFVTGSDFNKIEEQIPLPHLLKLFSQVYACNGTRVYNCNLDMDDETRPIEAELIHKTTLRDFYSIGSEF